MYLINEIIKIINASMSVAQQVPCYRSLTDFLQVCEPSTSRYGSHCVCVSANLRLWRLGLCFATFPVFDKEAFVEAFFLRRSKPKTPKQLKKNHFNDMPIQKMYPGTLCCCWNGKKLISIFFVINKGFSGFNYVLCLMITFV